MPGIALNSGLISYYGNPVGYTEKNVAVVDSGFQNKEFTAWLTARALTPAWTDGVMERLIAGGQMGSTEPTDSLKNVRIWQLKPETNVCKKFISLDAVEKQFGGPVLSDYRIVYDGQLGTNDLQAIDARCRTNPPFCDDAHPLAMSDVVELYDEGGSEYHYCDRLSFTPIDFAYGQTEDI